MIRALHASILLFACYFATAQQVDNIPSYQNSKNLYLFNFTDGQSHRNGNTIEFTIAVRDALMSVDKKFNILQNTLPNRRGQRKDPIVNTVTDIEKKYLSGLSATHAERVMYGTLVQNSTKQYTFVLVLYNLNPFRKIGSFSHVFTDDEFLKDKNKREMILEMVKTLVFKNASDAQLSEPRNHIEIKRYIEKIPGGEYEDIPTPGATFRIMYLTAEKRWKYANVTEIEDGSTLDDVIKNYLPAFPDFESATGLIAVGVASQEGGDIKKEESRAQKRADNLLFQLRSIRSEKLRELYTLNLGQHTNEVRDLRDHDNTSYQRRVIVMGILKKDTTMSFPELKIAVGKALESSEGFKLGKEKYSLFEFTKSK